jgi:hypothetical protein
MLSPAFEWQGSIARPADFRNGAKRMFAEMERAGQRDRQMPANI